MWFEALQDRVSLVCLVDDPEDSENTIIAGVNVLAIAHKNQEKKEVDLITFNYYLFNIIVYMLNNIIDPRRGIEEGLWCCYGG